MREPSGLAAALLPVFWAFGAHANPVVSESTVTFPATTGWYQIQQHDWSNVCQKGPWQ